MHTATIRHGLLLNGTSLKRQIKTQESEIFATHMLELTVSYLRTIMKYTSIPSARTIPPVLFPCSSETQVKTLRLKFAASHK